MIVDLYTPPALGYGWLPESMGAGGPLTGRPVLLRPGQWLGGVPRLAAIPDEAYLQVYTHLIQNQGADNGGLPISRQAAMPSCHFLRDANPGKPILAWNQNECVAAVDNLFANRHGGWAFLVSQLHEAYLALEPWGVPSASAQARWIFERMQQRLDPVGGRLYGGYHGHSLNRYNRDSSPRPDELRAALADPNASLAMCLRLANQDDPFYREEAWRYRHGCLNVYHEGSDNMHQFVGENVVMMQLDRQARQAAGTDRRVALIAFSGYTDQNNYSVSYTRPVADGQAQANGYPLWTSAAQIGLYFAALADDFDFYSWEFEVRYGTDPNVLLDGQVYTGSGQPGRGYASVYYNPDGPVAYPPNPQGGQDLVFVAADMLSRAGAWAGFGNQPTRHRVGTGNWLETPGGYLMDRYQSGDGYCRLGARGSYRWLWYLNTALGADQFETVEADLLGGKLTFETEGGVPLLFFIKL